MTATERKASIERILAAVKNVVSTVSQELQKGGDSMDDEATHGAAIELLRGAPELAESLGHTVPGLTATARAAASSLANQLRVLLTAAAYVLMQELRLRAARTGCARTQVTWLRDRLLKLGVHVVGSARRIVLHLPRATPHLHAWRRIALALGARAG